MSRGVMSRLSPMASSSGGGCARARPRRSAYPMSSQPLSRVFCVLGQVQRPPVQNPLCRRTGANPPAEGARNMDSTVLAESHLPTRVGCAPGVRPSAPASTKPASSGEGGNFAVRSRAARISTSTLSNLVSSWVPRCLHVRPGGRAPLYDDSIVEGVISPPPRWREYAQPRTP